MIAERWIRKDLQGSVLWVNRDTIFAICLEWLSNYQNPESAHPVSKRKFKLDRVRLRNVAITTIYSVKDVKFTCLALDTSSVCKDFLPSSLKFNGISLLSYWCSWESSLLLASSYVLFLASINKYLTSFFIRWFLSV